jgi:predicted nucleic acid-binding protein
MMILYFPWLKKYIENDGGHGRGTNASPLDQPAADQFRRLQNRYRIGRADLLIACITLAHHAILVTRNTKHFHVIPNLRLENWME